MPKNRIVIVAVILIAIIIIASFVFVRPQSGAPGSAGTSGTGVGAGSGPTTTPTRIPAPANVTVPAAGQTTSTPPGVAVPQTVAPANAHSSSSYRSFNIQANSDQFTPNTIIVRQEDIVNIFITAVDKSYDFTQPDYGFRESIAKGQTKQIQFGATATGKFTFYCKSCGGPASGPVGYIIVK